MTSVRLGLFAAVLLSAVAASAQDGGVSGSLMSATVQESGGGVALELTANTSQRLSCGDFLIADPPQIVVQCAGITIGDLDPILSVDDAWVSRVEFAEASDAEGTSTEIRVILKKVYEYDLALREGGLTITVHSGDAAAEDDGMDAIAAAMEEEDATTSSAPGEPQLHLESTRTGALSSVDGDHIYGSGDTQVRGVDFQQRAQEGISRLIITGSRRLDYETSYPSDQRMVVSIRDAALGTGLERRIDTTQFASAVSGVSAFRSRQVKGEVKIVVDLREAVTPTISERDNVVLVDFPIPPSIAGAAYDAAETVQSYEEPEVVEDEVQQSAIARERLIGGGGRILDPAKSATHRVEGVFGQDGVFLGDIDPNHQWKGFPINLNLVNANIHNVFRLIQAVSKLNIVSSDDVEGTVTVQLQEVPWDQAMAAILQAKGLGAMQYGNIIRVAPIETIRKEREDAAAAKSAETESLPLRVLTLPLNYAAASDVMGQLEDMLSKRGSITHDERTNSLIIRDIDRNLSQLRQLVKALDTRTPQVHIEARIVEANSQMSRNLGIQWGGNLNFSPATGAPTGAFFPNSIGASGANTATTVTPTARTIGGRPSNFTTVPNYVVDLPAQSSAGALGLSLGSLTGVLNLDARLTAGESAGTGRIISAPSITTVTNKTATIRDGARIPYETASLRGTNVQFVEATLLLKVTPQITADGTIFLEINITKNRPDFGGAVRGLPTIQIKEAETTVMVADGDTTVIGGVYNFEESVSKTFVPGLGRIPVLGWLFKTTTKREDRRELLVFITPTIVRQLQ